MKMIIKPGNQATPFTIEGLHYRTEKPVSIYVLGGMIVEIKEISPCPGTLRIFILLLV